MRFEIWQTPRGEQRWRWRLVAANNRKVATSGEGFTNRKDMLDSIVLVRGRNDWPIIDKASGEEVMR